MSKIRTELHSGVHNSRLPARVSICVFSTCFISLLAATMVKTSAAVDRAWNQHAGNEQKKTILSIQQRIFSQAGATDMSYVGRPGMLLYLKAITGMRGVKYSRLVLVFPLLLCFYKRRSMTGIP